MKISSNMFENKVCKCLMSLGYSLGMMSFQVPFPIISIRLEEGYELNSS